MKTYLALLLLLFSSTSSTLALEYSCVTNGYFANIHILKVNPNEYALKAIKSDADRQSVASLCTEAYGLAAINGGFWKQSGVPAGLLKVDNTYYGFGRKMRGAIGWSDGGKHVAIDRVEVIHHDDSIILTPTFDKTLSWESFTHIVGGAPLLVKDGTVIEDFSSEQTLAKFLTKNYARTAIGITKEGSWVLVVVEGFPLSIVGGMSIAELACFMHDLGCIDALNLDGGSSSTMVMGGLVMNSTYGSTYQEGHFVECVSDAIVVVPINQD